MIKKIGNNVELLKKYPNLDIVHRLESLRELSRVAACVEESSRILKSLQ